MNCAEFEVLLADYIDETLDAGRRAALEAHASSCSGCREFLENVTGAVSFLSRAQDIEPPADLVTRIAYLAPIGRSREPVEKAGLISGLVSRFLQPILQPILQPRLAMGMAMTILSFAMLERCTGVRVQHIQAEDLNPARILDGIEDKSMRAKDRAVKYYENIRLVYEIETKLRDFQDDQQDQSSQKKNVKNPARPEDKQQ